MIKGQRVIKERERKKREIGRSYRLNCFLFATDLKRNEKKNFLTGREAKAPGINLKADTQFNYQESIWWLIPGEGVRIKGSNVFSRSLRKTPVFYLTLLLIIYTVRILPKEPACKSKHEEIKRGSWPQWVLGSDIWTSILLLFACVAWGRTSFPGGPLLEPLFLLSFRPFPFFSSSSPSSAPLLLPLHLLLLLLHVSPHRRHPFPWRHSVTPDILMTLLDF